MSKFSMGLMNQLGNALEAAGYTSESVTEMRSNVPRLRDFLEVLEGTADVITRRHIIDLDADPRALHWCTIEEHIKGGSFEWDPAKVVLYRTPKQQEGDEERIYDDQFREEMKAKLPYNANLLDYLLQHPHLIPEEWEGKAVIFWGTIYRLSSHDDLLFVRVIVGGEGRWSEVHEFIEEDGHDKHPRFFEGYFPKDHPALVPASSS